MGVGGVAPVVARNNRGTALDQAAATHGFQGGAHRGGD
jgi:hypothetical protein